MNALINNIILDYNIDQHLFFIDNKITIENIYNCLIHDNYQDYTVYLDNDNL